MTRKITPAQLDEIEATAIGKQVAHAAINGEPDKHFATTLALVAEVRELRGKVERVRALHEKCDTSGACFTCTNDGGGLAEWPCDTIEALGEEA